MAQVTGCLTMKNLKLRYPELTTWIGLNEALMATTDEKYLTVLLKKEQSGKNRSQFVKRIHSRLNKVRADRERKEFQSHMTG